MKRFGDFSFGVLYSGKEKVRRKAEKWIRIVRDSKTREKWEDRLISQGDTYRHDLIRRFQQRIHMGGLLKDDERYTDEIRRSRVHIGQRLSFYAQDQAAQLQGTVSLTNFYPNDEYFLVKADAEGGGTRSYICRDCGDRFIGDTEF